MTYEIFLMRVEHRSGVDDGAMVQELVHRVVSELGATLSGEAGEFVARCLPEPLASELRSSHAGGLGEGEPPTALYRCIGDALGIDAGFAVEFTRVVCQVLSECVGSERRTRLISELGEDWEDVFLPRKVDFGPRPELAIELGPADSSTRDDLAEGRPGSDHPLSERDVGQHDSLARTDTPHEGDQLATSHGKPERRTLAGGRPGSSRSINEPGRHT